MSIDQDTRKLSFKEVPDYEKIKSLNGITVEFYTHLSTASAGARFFVELYNNQNQTNKITPITTNNFIEYVSDVS